MSYPVLATWQKGPKTCVAFLGIQIRQDCALSSLARWGHWFCSADGKSHWPVLHSSATVIGATGQTTEIPRNSEWVSCPAGLQAVFSSGQNFELALLPRCRGRLGSKANKALWRFQIRRTYPLPSFLVRLCSKARGWDYYLGVTSRNSFCPNPRAGCCKLLPLLHCNLIPSGHTLQIPP